MQTSPLCSEICAELWADLVPATSPPLVVRPVLESDLIAAVTTKVSCSEVSGMGQALLVGGYHGQHLKISMAGVGQHVQH